MLWRSFFGYAAIEDLVCGPRLDAPETLHYVMTRSLKRQPIFRDELDEDNVVRRLAILAKYQAATRDERRPRIGNRCFRGRKETE